MKKSLLQFIVIALVTVVACEVVGANQVVPAWEEPCGRLQNPFDKTLVKGLGISFDSWQNNTVTVVGWSHGVGSNVPILSHVPFTHACMSAHSLTNADVPVVVAVPHWLSDDQRQKIKDDGTAALQSRIDRLLNEESAALSFLRKDGVPGEAFYLVVRNGNVTLLAVDNGSFEILEYPGDIEDGLVSSVASAVVLTSDNNHDTKDDAKKLIYDALPMPSFEYFHEDIIAYGASREAAILADMVDCSDEVLLVESDSSFHQHSFTSGYSSRIQLAQSLGAPRYSPLTLSVGGAKNIANFRESIAGGFLPQLASLPSEGLFYEYTFNSTRNKDGDAEEADVPDECMEEGMLLCPNYALGFSQGDAYVTLGLNSGKPSAFSKRPDNLNIVVLVDTSGSMSSHFYDFYYRGPNDIPGGSREHASTMTKIEAAKKALVNIIDNLDGAKDKVGIVLFGDSARVFRPLIDLSEDSGNTKARVDWIQADGGGTNMDVGIQQALAMLRQSEGAGEKRVIVLTDAEINAGVVEEDRLFATLDDAAEKNGIYFSFVGIGIDFNNDLIRRISNVRGANFLALDLLSSLMADKTEFDNMITPVAYDVQANLASDDFDIDAVFGVPNASLSIKSLFPSSQGKGGIILIKLKLKEISRQATKAPHAVTLTVEYVEAGTKQKHSVAKTIDIDINSVLEDRYDTPGIKRAIVLSRYLTLLHDWITAVQPETGGGWERTPVAITKEMVGGVWRERLVAMRQSLTAAADDELAKEVQVLDKLMAI